jgi:hypothetical protein
VQAQQRNLKRKNRMKKQLLVGILLAGMSFALQAAQISGSIGFTGEYSQNGGTLGNLATATSMTITEVRVDTATGTFVGAGAPLTFASPIGVNGNPPSLVGGNLWTVTVGGTVFSFVVTSQSQPFTSATQINIQGTGTIDDGAGGFDPTAGVFQLGFGVSGASFTWQSTSAGVPDGGMSVALLGIALAGLGFMRRTIMGA